MYYNIKEDKKIVSNIEFRQLFPNIIFPKILTDEIMEEYGYKRIVINKIDATKYTRVVNGEIEIIDGIPTINQQLSYLPLNECKTIAINGIKEQRELAISEDINNIQVATVQDRDNIQGTIQHFDVIALNTIVWTMADNTEKELSLQELQDTITAYVIRKANAFVEYQTKKQLIENCTTVDELESIYNA